MQILYSLENLTCWGHLSNQTSYQNLILVPLATITILFLSHKDEPITHQIKKRWQLPSFGALLAVVCLGAVLLVYAGPGAVVQQYRRLSTGPLLILMLVMGPIISQVWSVGRSRVGSCEILRSCFCSHLGSNAHATLYGFLRASLGKVLFSSSKTLRFSYVICMEY